MASQNVDPTRINSNARKQKDKSDVLPGGLHSVTLRSVENSLTNHVNNDSSSSLLRCLVSDLDICTSL